MLGKPLDGGKYADASVRMVYAGMAMQGILSGPPVLNVDGKVIDTIGARARLALDLADELISAAERAGAIKPVAGGGL